MSGKKFDPAKPCHTENGKIVRILCVDLNRGFNQPPGIVVAIKDSPNGTESVAHYTPEGKYYWNKKSPLDLVNDTEITFHYRNVYADPTISSVGWSTAEIANKMAKDFKRLGILEVEYHDGEAVSCKLLPLP